MAKTRKTIDEKWNMYDRSVGMCHLSNFGKIYLDSYGKPIDDEYLVSELVRKERAKNKR